MNFIDKEPEKYVGWGCKYDVYKCETGDVVLGCFVLRPDKEPAARVALKAYDEATQNHVLAADLYHWLEHFDPQTAENADILRQAIQRRMDRRVEMNLFCEGIKQAIGLYRLWDSRPYSLDELQRALAELDEILPEVAG